MKHAEYGLAILGLNRVERMTVSSVCALTQFRSRGYAVLPEDRGTDADIMLVDADDPRMCTLWETSPMRRQGRPAVMIGRDQRMLGTQPYSLLRTNFAARLIRVLDQITIGELTHASDIAFGDMDALDVEPGTSIDTVATLRAAQVRVLVVGDAETMRTSVLSSLEFHAVHADLATDVLQARAYMMASRYAIVFLLPGANGHAICRQLKSTDRTSTPIVMITDSRSALARLRSTLAGCDRQVKRPITANDLRQLLGEYAPLEVA